MTADVAVLGPRQAGSRQQGRQAGRQDRSVLWEELVVCSGEGKKITKKESPLFPSHVDLALFPHTRHPNHALALHSSSRVIARVCDGTAPPSPDPCRKSRFQVACTPNGSGHKTALLPWALAKTRKLEHICNKQTCICVRSATCHRHD